MEKKQKFSYEKAISEIENIVNTIESGDCSIDELTEEIKKATLLIKNCQQKLQSIETDLSKINEE